MSLERALVIALCCVGATGCSREERVCKHVNGIFEERLRAKGLEVPTKEQMLADCLERKDGHTAESWEIYLSCAEGASNWEQSSQCLRELDSREQD